MSESVICPHCKQTNPPGVNFCVHCGANLTTNKAPAPRPSLRRRGWLRPLVIGIGLLALGLAVLVWLRARPGSEPLPPTAQAGETAATGEAQSVAVGENGTPLAAGDASLTPATTPTGQDGAAGIAPASRTPRATPTTMAPTAVVLPDAIVFNMEVDGDHQIFIHDIDSEARRQLTQGPGENMMPAVSLDGQRIVFISTRDGAYEVYVMARDGSGQKRLTHEGLTNQKPVWSPDGRQIAFHSVRNGQIDIFIINSDGALLTQVTDSPDSEYTLSWSSDNRLAFDAYLTAEYQIYTSAIDGSELRQLTTPPGPHLSPSWSPDGSQILFLGNPDSAEQGLYLMNADGSDVRLIHNSPGKEIGAAWSADGSQIVFSAIDPQGFLDLYLIDADGTGSRWLGPGSNPSWAAGTATAPPEAIAPPPTVAALAPEAAPLATDNCPIAPDARWATTLWEPNKDKLGCATGEIVSADAIHQYFDYGNTFWREDTDHIYAIYHNGTFASVPATGPGEFFVSDEIRGKVGYLWTNDAVVRGQLGEPVLAEMRTIDFHAQEFAGGAIVSYLYMPDSTVSYALFNRDRTWTFVQE